jgi:hypothetical protein
VRRGERDEARKMAVMAFYLAESQDLDDGDVAWLGKQRSLLESWRNAERKGNGNV